VHRCGPSAARTCRACLVPISTWANRSGRSSSIRVGARTLPLWCAGVVGRSRGQRCSSPSLVGILAERRQGAGVGGPSGSEGERANRASAGSDEIHFPSSRRRQPPSTSSVCRCVALPSRVSLRRWDEVIVAGLLGDAWFSLLVREGVLVKSSGWRSHRSANAVAQAMIRHHSLSTRRGCGGTLQIARRVRHGEGS
jgi:hypothetical protein